MPWQLRATLALVIALCFHGQSASAGKTTADRPNVLWITCEDISPWLGCYGDPHAITPNLDRLAGEGVRYTNAFAVASVCSPSRSCLITGVYPTSLGTQHLRATLPLPEPVRCFSEYLRRAGYYCTNNVKQDYQFVAPPESWDESSGTAHWRNRKRGQPFFAVFNLTTTHQGQIRLPDAQFAKRTARLKPEERHDPATIALPPYYPNTPVVRRDVARLYDLITAMDQQAGNLLRQLEEDGLADDTIVFFYSDHGNGMPRHKRWLYDSGIRVPLIVRFPKKYQHLAPGRPGSACDRLVSFVDFAPTMLSLLGLEIPDYMQGRAFLGPKAGPPREYIFAVRDRVDECYEMSRTVRDKRFHYIRNYMPHRPVMQRSEYSEQTPTRQEFRRLAAQGALHGPPARMMSPTKPAEELYDTQNDPHELRNLAESPEHGEVLTRMRRELRQWMIESRDTGLLPEAELYRRSAGRSPYDMTKNVDRFPVARILEAAELVGRGPEKLDELTARLSDPEAGVRYWAAVGLRVLGTDAAPAAKALMAALEDPCPNVRFAAAEALGKLGADEKAVPVLAAGLEHEDRWVRLAAAMSLVAVGEDAQVAVPAMRKAVEDKAKHQAVLYTRWALHYALSRLQP